MTSVCAAALETVVWIIVVTALLAAIALTITHVRDRRRATRSSS